SCPDALTLGAPVVTVASVASVSLLFRALRQLPAATIALAVQEARQTFGLRGPQIQAVDRLREAQVSIDAGDHDARVDGKDLDADDRYAHVGIDDQTLVEDQVEYICE